MSGALYEWPVPRTSKEFRGAVVEFAQYAPRDHASLFQAVLTALVAPPLYREGGESSPRPRPEALPPPDLITFPEALLPLATLHEVLRDYAGGPQGLFVHVGLRYDESENHLIPIDAISTFIEQLHNVAHVASEDLTLFADWLKQQQSEARFNLGCVFGLDARDRLRICIHAKLVRSKYEFNLSETKHMKEAGLLSVIALTPDKRSLNPIYIQPLLCSDALFVDMDRPERHPLRALNDGTALFSRRVERIDIVSLACCTPCSADTTKGDRRSSQWHPDFREVAVRISKEDTFHRHHGAAIFKSNFRMIDSRQLPGGLSGVYFPHKLSELPSIELMNSVYGSFDNGENRWYANDDIELDRSTWPRMRPQGHIYAVAGNDAPASLLTFCISRLSNDAKGWGGHGRCILRHVEVRDLRHNGESFVFEYRGMR